MAKPTGRRIRTEYTPIPVDPSKFVHIDRPSDRSLRGSVITGFVLWIGAGAVIGACGYFWFINSAATDLYLPAAVGASIAVALGIRNTLKAGRKRREDWIRCGGDPTGMSDLMFGTMRGYRTAEGEWVVPEQGSGDYF